MKLPNWLRPAPGVRTVQTAAPKPHPFALLEGYTPLATPEAGLYSAMREAVPIVDAAIEKIVRLTVGFVLECDNPAAQAELNRFAHEVQVGACGQGLARFAAGYLDSLLTYGNAVGEMVPAKNGQEIAALYNAPLSGLRVRTTPNPLEVELGTVGEGGEFVAVRHPQLVLFTPLNPPAGEIGGVSLLRSLPFVSSILLKIYHAIGQNFQRVANLRYAVTYRPGASGVDRLSAKEIAGSIAQQWGEAMSATEAGVIKDFVAVGDVDIKVIGADCQMLDCEVPMRQMLEQIVAKLGLPPFMLGLHWSTTERMSKQQADILTSELESYRSLLETVLLRICRTQLLLKGLSGTPRVRWYDINLQDEQETANTRLINAQAAEIEKRNGGLPHENTQAP